MPIILRNHNEYVNTAITLIQENNDECQVRSVLALEIHRVSVPVDDENMPTTNFWTGASTGNAPKKGDSTSSASEQTLLLELHYEAQINAAMSDERVTAARLDSRVLESSAYRR